MRLMFALLSLLLLSGCANLVPSQAPAREVAGLHDFGTTRLAFSPDGKQVASGGYLGTVSVNAVPNGDRTWSGRRHQDAVRGLAWVSSEILATAGEDGQVHLLAADSGRVLESWQGIDEFSAMVWVPGARRLVVGGSSGRLIALALPGLRPVASFSMGAPVLALAFDARKGRVAASTDNGRVLLLDATLNQVAELPRPDRDALSLRFSHDGRQLAAGAWFAVYYWDLELGTLRRQETEHWGAVIDIDFSPDDRQLASIGRHTDATLRLVDSRSGQVQRRLQAHKLCGATLAISPDGSWLASGSDDESLRFYDLSQPYQPR